MKRSQSLALILVLTCIIAAGGFGQNIANYSFSATSGSLTPITGGTPVATSVSAADFLGDTKTSVPLPIGFTFFYMGVPYTHVVAMSDGYLSFNLSATSTGTNNLATTSATQRPLIAPLWDDLDGASGTGAANYLTTGSPGARIFTIEWLNWQWNWSATGNTISFQVKLYEATGAIEFVYRDDGGTVYSGSASIGVCATATGSGNFLSLNGTGASPTAGSTTETTTLSTKPANGQVYTFTPPSTAPTAPTWQSPTSITGSSMQLNWLDNSSNETGFAILRSTDGTNYTYVFMAAANATSYSATGLNFGTTYYWQVYANNEGLGSTSASGSQATNSPSLTGIKYVSTGTNTPDYSNLTDAFTAIKNNGLAGNLTLVLQSGYPSTAEPAYPIVGPTAASVGSFTVTIYPDASGRSITSASTTGTLDLNGSKNIIIDGRVNGAGSTKDLVVENTSTSGFAIRFINDATSNTIKYCVVKGVNTSITNGVILFSTTTGTTGNDYNTIDNNDIRDGATKPANCIYSGGTATYLNNNNTVSNNSIFNFMASASNHCGINLGANNSAWTISGNSFFQTGAGYAGPGTYTAYPIYVSNTGTAYQITNNYLGGNASSCSGTWTINGTAVAYKFVGIYLSQSTSTGTNIQGNVIKGFSWLTNSSASTEPGVWCGMYLAAGSADIGTSSSNYVGETNSNGSVTVQTNSNSGTINYGIVLSAGSGCTVNCNNNYIGSVTTIGGTTSIGTGFRGISNTTGGTITISNNVIGSLTQANSINLSTATTGSVVQEFTGVRNSSSTPTLVISNNTIANVNNATTSTSSSALTRGITTAAATNTIAGNTVRNMNSSSGGTGSGTTSTVHGISITGTAGSFAITGNTIHSLSNSNTGAIAVHVSGIAWGSSTSTAGLVNKNFVHSLSSSTTSSSTGLYGITYTGSGNTTTFANNMIRLGIDASGNSVTSAFDIRGFNEVAGNNSFYHNSVYIGGTGVTNTTSTYAFYSSTTTNARDFRNNIFVNDRSYSAAGTAVNVAAYVSGTLPNPAGLTMNYNIYKAGGTGGVLFRNSTTNYVTLASWQTASGMDGSSGVGDPNYANTTGASSAVDLHVVGTTPAEGAGTSIASVTDDYDGQTRSNFSAVDIGADAGNFGALDIFAPAISFTVLSNGIAATSRTLNNFATIVDNVGTSTGENLPRLYYKKSTDNNIFGGNTSSDNGWKYVLASNTSSPFSFTIDYTIINGGSVIAGDVIQYFVVAQDDAFNLTSKVAGASAGSNPPVQNINAYSGAANSYTVAAAFSGAYNVGTGQTYTTLTGASPNGLFAALNAGVVTGNITVNIMSDMSELGTNGLSQQAEDGAGAGTYTITIQPDAATMRTISGSVAAPMINLNGADRVTIDGRFGGSGRYLTFRNTNTSNATIALQNDATNNTIRNVVVEGATTSTTNGVVFISSSATTTGNDNNTLTDNQIRDRSDASGVPGNLIYSQGFSGAITNTGNTVTNNDMFNFTSNGIQTTNTGNENWTITGNTVYQTGTRTTTLVGINFNSLGTNTISQNTIRDLNTSSSAIGINLANAFTTTCSRNRIYSIPSTSGSTGTLTGINYSGGSGLSTSVTIVNNQISIIPSFSNSQPIYGIRDFAYTGNTIVMYYNSVFIGGTATGNASWAFQRGTSTPTTLTARNNIFFNNRTGGSVNHFALGDQSANTGTWTSDHNLFVGTGTTASNFMDYGTSSTGAAVSFSTWKTGPPTRDANSYAETATNINAANLYTNVTAGSENLNINAANAESWFVNGKGVAIAALATDIDGDARSITAGVPSDIGADEFTPGVGAPLITGSPAPAFGGTTDFVFAGRTVASITWGADPGGGATVPTSITMQYFSGQYPSGTVTGSASNAYWRIEPTGGSGFSYDIRLYYTQAELGSLVEAFLLLAKTDGTGAWRTIEASVPVFGPPRYVITTSPLTTFSNFTLTASDSPLPVQIASFTGIEIPNQGVKLEWRTISEVNNYGFYIQRKRSNDLAWTEVENSFVGGHGTTNEPQQYEFHDRSTTAGSWLYRLRQVDLDNSSHFTEPIEVGVVTSVREVAPIEFALKQNYPNPFNPETSIKFSVEQTGRATLEVYNILGQRLMTLFDDVVEAGFYRTVKFNASNLASGMYLYRLQSGAKSELKKLLLLR